MSTSSSKSAPLYVKVAAVRQEADTIRSYCFEALDGGDLPEFTAGAHVGIIMPGRITRYYSLCNSPRDRRRYIIGVQREDEGRGGSLLVHKRLSVGKMLMLHRPRNLFPLAPDGHHLLVAGGIGITPMLSMASELEDKGQSYHLVFSARGKASIPFLESLNKLVVQRKATIYDTSKSRPDFDRLLFSRRDDSHVYFCGPPGFMKLVRQACAHWPPGTVHSESFSPVVANVDDSAFIVEARRSDKTFNVGPDQSILQALRENDIEVDSVCENGTCGTCKVRYLSGSPDHRDAILSPAEQKEHVMVCVSRSKQLLVLDI